MQWRPNILEPSVRSQRDGSCGNRVPTGTDEFNEVSSGGGTLLRHGSSKCNGARATQYARPVRRGLVHGSDEGDIKMLGPEQGEHQLVTHNELPRSAFHIEHPTGAPGDGEGGGETNRGTTSGSFSPPLVPPPPIGLQTEPENTAHCVPPLRIALNVAIAALHTSKANLAVAPGGETGGGDSHKGEYFAGSFPATLGLRASFSFLQKQPEHIVCRSASGTFPTTVAAQKESMPQISDSNY